MLSEIINSVLKFEKYYETVFLDENVLLMLLFIGQTMHFQWSVQ